MHPSTRGLLKFFEYGHLPKGNMRDTSAQFSTLAHILADDLPANAETTTALRKLLEAKDCAVRSWLVEPAE